MYIPSPAGSVPTVTTYDNSNGPAGPNLNKKAPSTSWRAHPLEIILIESTTFVNPALNKCLIFAFFFWEVFSFFVRICCLL